MRNTVRALQSQVNHPLVEQLRQQIDYCLAMATDNDRYPHQRLDAIAGAILGTDDAALEEQANRE